MLLPVEGSESDHRPLPRAKSIHGLHSQLCRRIGGTFRFVAKIDADLTAENGRWPFPLQAFNVMASRATRDSTKRHHASNGSV